MVDAKKGIATILELTGSKRVESLCPAGRCRGRYLPRPKRDRRTAPRPIIPLLTCPRCLLSSVRPLYPSSWSSPHRVYPVQTSPHHSTPPAPGGGGRRGIRHRNEAALGATRPKHATRALRSGESPPPLRPPPPFLSLPLSHYLIHMLAAASMSMSIYRLGIGFYFMGIGMITGIPPNCFARDVLRSISR
jgi:hypothetical protein